MPAGFQVFDAAGNLLFDSTDTGWAWIACGYAAAGVSGSQSFYDIAAGRTIRAHSVPVLNGAGHNVSVDDATRVVTWTAITLPSVFLHRTSGSWIYVFGR